MKRWNKGIVSVLLVMALTISMTIGAEATSIDDAKKKAETLENQKDTAESEQASLSAQLEQIMDEMEQAKAKLAQKQEEIQIAENELVEAKIDENDQYTNMKKRIRFMYENGNTQFFEILIKSESIGDFLNKAEYVSQISAYDREMLREFQDVLNDVLEREQKLQEEYKELDVLQSELVEKQKEVSKLLEEKELQISDLEKQIGDNAALLQKLLEEAEAERQKQLAQQKAEEEAKKLAASQGSSGSANVVISGSGVFTNPCPGGYISSTFGYRDFDSSHHNGLDLAASEGTPTYAADSGTVVIAGWSDSAGNWVVINHGNGVVTKYMHHSAISVVAGQTVTKGQQIGYVGNTGNSFGAHLHFQVEVNGTAVDPLGYL
jgi:murein DD-endopeptidase MepM/ murein hydrolase activator NlpD